MREKSKRLHGRLQQTQRNCSRPIARDRVGHRRRDRDVHDVVSRGFRQRA